MQVTGGLVNQRAGRRNCNSYNTLKSRLAQDCALPAPPRYHGVRAGQNRGTGFCVIKMDRELLGPRPLALVKQSRDQPQEYLILELRRDVQMKLPSGGHTGGRCRLTFHRKENLFECGNVFCSMSGTASAAIVPSMRLRTRRTSSAPSSPEQSGDPPFGVVIMIPEPGRTSTYPSTSKAISASRMEGRETPNCFASSRSAGRRLPVENSPAAISDRT